jgi:hypothetical protein
MVPSPGFQSRFFVLANENRTQDAGHALLRQGRNPKVRKNSGVIGLLFRILVFHHKVFKGVQTFYIKNSYDQGKYFQRPASAYTVIYDYYVYYSQRRQ